MSQRPGKGFGQKPSFIDLGSRRNPASGVLRPNDHEVFLWSLDLAASALLGYDFTELLSDAERQRADSFRFADDARRFVAARGFLRRVLAWHLGIAPEDIRLSEPEGGKPAVVQAPLQFSLTRSSGIVIVAISRHTVGVDAEVIRSVVDITALSGELFSAADLATWQRLESAARADCLYRTWTRKEALGKALGTGISVGMATLGVPIDDCPAGHCLAFTDPGEHRLWLLSELPTTTGRFASLVVPADNGARPVGYTDRKMEHPAVLPGIAQLCIRQFEQRFEAT